MLTCNQITTIYLVQRNAVGGWFLRARLSRTTRPWGCYHGTVERLSERACGAERLSSCALLVLFHSLDQGDGVVDIQSLLPSGQSAINKSIL